ncbi:MAG: copper resistance protein NlpE [Endomicrobium sp.]|nr:copper resistance protein NlpE [Endomicrobium sp.]
MQEYKGTLPGANGEMIFTELNLKTDYTYTLKQNI